MTVRIPTTGATLSVAVVRASMDIRYRRLVDGRGLGRVLVRNKDTNRYWNADLNGCQQTFVTVQAVLSSSDGGTQSAWTVEIPTARSAVGEFASEENLG